MTGGWKKYCIPLLLFVGCKMNAIFYYHLMEFTHATMSPQNLVPYFSVEGPYIVSMALVSWKIYKSLYTDDQKKKKTN